MNKGKIRLFSVFVAMFVTLIALTGLVNAFSIVEVELDEDRIDQTSTNFIQDLDKGDKVTIKVHFLSDVDRDDVQVEAALRGYDHGDLVEDITDVFDARAGVTYVKKLHLTFPIRLEEDQYRLRIRIDDRNGETLQQDYLLDVNPDRHSVEIFDVFVSPENGVQAGRAILTTARLKNRGEKDEEDIQVKVSIPALGISATDYLDQLDAEGDDDDSASTEELYMRIPQCAEPGDYTLRLDVTYDEGDERVSATMPITILGSDLCPLKQDVNGPLGAQPGKTIITVGPESQDVAAGTSGVVYPVTLTNTGSTTKTYIVGVQASDAFDVRVSPSNVVVLNAGESKAAYVYVSANENAQTGTQMFSVSIKSGDTVLKEVPLTANVVGAPSKSVVTTGGDSLKRGLEIGLVVLVVLLVILGLIIGFNKLKDSDDEEPKEPEQTYY